MAGKKEVGFLKPSKGNLKEQLVRTTLRNVKSQGHPYVELRKDGKKYIFFCTLCLKPCYGDANLFSHLKGNTHTKRLATARLTLLKPNPWPFNDGVFFFHDTEEQKENLPISNSEIEKLLDIHHVDADSRALVTYVENSGTTTSTHSLQEAEDSGDCDENPSGSNLDGDGTDRQLVIPAVLQKNEVSDLVVRHMGVGKITARYIEKDVDSYEARKVWCEWLGGEVSANEDIGVVTEHDFAVVTFSYHNNLGRSGFLDGFGYLLSGSAHSEGEDGGCSRGKKRKSFSDPEDRSGAVSNLDDSSGEESQSSNSSKSKILFSGKDDQRVYSRTSPSNTIRKELRDQLCMVSERNCDICLQKMLPNKDVAALLNRRTGKLVCSSRNSNGVFHMFHISCLIHWILLCEVEIYENQPVEPKAKPRSKRKVKGKKGKNGEKQELQKKKIYSTFCPQCQGTGLEMDGDEKEKPTVALHEIFNFKIKLCEAHKAWLKNPEILQNCSVGFDFPPETDQMYPQVTVEVAKLLHFYRADD